MKVSLQVQRKLPVWFGGLDYLLNKGLESFLVLRRELHNLLDVGNLFFALHSSAKNKLYKFEDLGAICESVNLCG